MHSIIGIDEAGRGPWAGPVVAGGFMIQAELTDRIPIIFPELDDSKKLTEKKRESIYGAIEYLSHQQECQFTFAYREASRIDEIGIRRATKECMEDIILSLTQFLSPDDTYEIWIDGCDNFTFESFEGEYSFAKKGRQSKGGKKMNGGSGGETVGDQRKSVQGGAERTSFSPTETFISFWSQKDIQKNVLSYLINGDSLHPIISLASIVAKVLRDRMMCEYSEEFPKYGFHLHKGYGTRKHLESIINYGITSIHRKSYAPVKRLISSTSSL